MSTCTHAPQQVPKWSLLTIEEVKYKNLLHTIDCDTKRDKSQSELKNDCNTKGDKSLSTIEVLRYKVCLCVCVESDDSQYVSSPQWWCACMVTVLRAAEWPMSCSFCLPSHQVISNCSKSWQMKITLVYTFSYYYKHNQLPHCISLHKCAQAYRLPSLTMFPRVFVSYGHVKCIECLNASKRWGLSFSTLYLRSTMPVTDASTANNIMMAMGQGGGRGMLWADCQPSVLCFEWHLSIIYNIAPSAVCIVPGCPRRCMQRVMVSSKQYLLLYYYK